MFLVCNDLKIVIPYLDMNISELEILTPSVVLTSSIINDGTDVWFKEEINSSDFFIYALNQNDEKYYICKTSDNKLVCRKDEKQIFTMHKNKMLLLPVKNELTFLGIEHDTLTDNYYMSENKIENFLVFLE